MLKKNSRQKKTHNKNSTHSKLKFKISIYFFQKKGCKVLNLSLSFILFYILIRDTLLKIVVKWVKMFMYGSILIFFWIFGQTPNIQHYLTKSLSRVFIIITKICPFCETFSPAIGTFFVSSTFSKYIFLKILNTFYINFAVLCKDFICASFTHIFTLNFEIVFCDSYDFHITHTYLLLLEKRLKNFQTET